MYRNTLRVVFMNCDCSFPAKIRLQVFNRIDILTVQVGNRLYIILCALTVNSEERRIYYKEITRYVGIGTYALKRADIREAFLPRGSVVRPPQWTADTTCTDAFYIGYDLLGRLLDRDDTVATTGISVATRSDYPVRTAQRGKQTVMRNVRGKLSSAASGERVAHSGRVPRRGEKRERTPQGAVADDRRTSVPILPAHRKSAPAGDNDIYKFYRGSTATSTSVKRGRTSR
ncbi:hypothetical protein QTP88_012965 [Uroleucon formosanum]